MKFLVIILSFLNLAIAAESEISHIVKVKSQVPGGELVFYITKVAGQDKNTEAAYRHQRVSTRNGNHFIINFEEIAHVLDLKVYSKDERDNEILRSFKLELANQEFISVEILDNRTCAVLSTHYLLTLPTTQIVPCTYSTVTSRGGMSGSN